MTRPTRIEMDCATGVETIHELTDEEIAQREADSISHEAELTARAEAKAIADALKASAKAKLIAGEPLTAEEADTLVI